MEVASKYKVIFMNQSIGPKNPGNPLWNRISDPNQAIFSSLSNAIRGAKTGAPIL
jgi:hypothetical protein